MSKKTDEKKIKDMTTEEKRALIENWKDNLTPEERETARELAEMIGSFSAWWNSDEIRETRQAAGEMLQAAADGIKVAAEIFAALREFLPALVEEMEKDGTAATMTASEFIESGKFDEIVDRTAERLQNEGITKEEIREVITENLFTKPFMPMYNSPITNDLMRITKNIMEKERGGTQATFTTPDGNKIEIRKFGEVQSGLSASADMILNAAQVALTAINYHRTDASSVNNIVEIPLFEYAEKRGLLENITPRTMPTPEEQAKENRRADNALKDFRRQLRRDLKAWQECYWTATIKTGKRKNEYIEQRIIYKSKVWNDRITIYFDQDAAAMIANGGVIQYPDCLLLHDAKNPNAYKIGYKIAFHNSLDNNAASGTDCTLSVTSLLAAAPEIPTYEKLQERGQRNWKDKIKKVLEKNLQAQIDVGLISKWEYRDPSTNKRYNEKTANALTWAKYSRLRVDFIMVEPKEHRLLQDERRQKRAEEKAQAAKEAGKTRRKRGRPRKNEE